MKLTPLDIHHKEFRHALRGYNEEEVDQFLDQVADEFERLFKENIDLSERLDALQNKVNEFEMQRQTINNTLMTAQRSADDIIARAQAEADGIIGHANTRAKEIVNDALAKKQQVRGELLRIKQAEEEFRERYRALLESNLKSISVVAMTDDVSALLGESDDAVEAVAPMQVSASVPAYEPPVLATPEPPVVIESEPVIDHQVVPISEPVAPAPKVDDEPSTSIPAPFVPISIEDLPGPDEFDELRDVVQLNATQPMPAADDSVSGLISAVSLGELEAPEIPDDIDLVEPSEFSLPRFDALGEREDDIDIEEID